TAGCPNRTECVLVALLGLGSKRFQRRRAGVADDRGGAGHGLEAAISTAVAGIAVAIDHDVTDLAGCLVVATEQLVLEDQPGTDAAAYLDDREVRGSDVALEQVCREGGGTAVVGDDRREVVALLEDLRERQVLPVEAHGPADRAGLVDDARRPDADPED